MESDLIPYSSCLFIPARAVLVLAPHPDDEVFGCGGAIASHVQQGQQVHVVVLTDGALYGDVAVRQSESEAAAAALGYGSPEFWAFPDRELVYSDALVQRLVNKIITSGCDLVYSPSPWEVHPDHRQTTLIAIEAVRRVGHPVKIAFYEVGAPLRPNLLLDITANLALKERAMRCFSSQLLQQDYVQHIQALNRYRTYTLPRTVDAAEAYWILDVLELDQIQAGSFWSPVSPGGAADLTKLSKQQPLVSILIRSIDRTYLAQALDSIALQTYPSIEVVVVAAVPDHEDLPTSCGPFPMRLLPTNTVLPRSNAANKAIIAAKGQMLLLLDDDDWLMPDHIARLAHVLQRHPNALATYTGIALVDSQGKSMGQAFDLPFDAIRQLAGNLMPIHAVLFSAKVLELGCRFDETIDRYEDWDFWIQLAKLAPMVHLPGVSGVYRIHESSGVHSDPGTTGNASTSMYQKWETNWTREQIGQIMHRVWSHPDLEARLTDTQQRLTSAENQTGQLRDLNAVLKDAQAQRDLSLAQRDLSLTQRDLSLTQLDLVLVQRDRSIAERDLALTRQEFSLSTRETTLTHQEHAFQQQQSALTLRESSVSQQQAILSQQEVVVVEKMRLDAERQSAFESMARQKIEVVEKLEKSNHDLAAVFGSRSWRITQPLRWSATQLRRLAWLTTALRRLRLLLEVNKIK